jgi:nucleotide-binding universal stress UspA family protein
MNKPILVPLDGSNTSEMVIPYVEEIAANLGSGITLATVSESGKTDTMKLSETYLKRLEEQVRRGVKDLGGEANLKILTALLSGKPASEIMRYAQEIDAGLIVMASRGSSANEPWQLGSTAAKVIRASSKPVLLIRNPADETARRNNKLIKKILLPLDRSASGEAAVPYIEEMAQGLGAKLVLFHIVEPPVQTLTDPDVNTANVYSQKRERAAIAAYLSNIEKRLKTKGLSVSSVSEAGAPADVIIDYAHENAIDLIAMSTHGRSGIGRWLLGSVTEKVINAADTPVLVVRATKT